MPNPSGRMNDRERQICSRLKKLRERIGHSQRVLAAALSVGRDRLASIEYGRTPLQSDTAIRLAKITGCNLNWLADGEGPIYGPLPTPNFIEQIPPRCLFSRAWQAWLKAGLRPGAKQFGEASASGHDIGGAPAQDYLDEEMAGILKFLPPQFHWNFFAHMKKAGGDFVEMNQAAITKLKYDLENTSKINLTDSTTWPRLVDVKPQLPNLLARLNQATKETGKMSALADFLGKTTGHKVPLASVSRWLSDKREPGGEITLQMLRWVEQQERQK